MKFIIFINLNKKIDFNILLKIIMIICLFKLNNLTLFDKIEKRNDIWGQFINIIKSD